MLILSGVSGQQDLFVQNNETVSTSGLPGAETYLMISGSSESMENMLQIEEQVWEPIGIFSMVCKIWALSIALMQQYNLPNMYY